MKDWGFEPLWQKACIYFERAFDGDRESDLFPFFASLGLEFLARAALAKVHPALLADPRDGGNVLYAFGCPTTARPMSIVAKTIYSRLVHVVPKYNDEDQNFCLLFAERRNKELHTGQLGFGGLPTGDWLPDFYRVVAKIVDSCGKNLEDPLVKSEADVAREHLSVLEKSVVIKINKYIDAKKQFIAGLLPAELVARRASKGFKFSRTMSKDNGVHCQKKCPACESNGCVEVVPVGTTAARIKDGELVSQTFYSPKKFFCGVCDLKIEGSQELRAANLADQIIIEDAEDPVDFFGINPRDYIDPEDLRAAIDEDYGND
jgi:hypothetical protein